MNTWKTRLIGLGIALAITAVGFYFWIIFGAALGEALRVVYSEPKPERPSRSGPVEVQILAVPPAKPVCGDAQHPCPKDKPK